MGSGGGSKPVSASLFYLCGPKRQVMTPVEHLESQKVLSKHNPARLNVPQSLKEPFISKH